MDFVFDDGGRAAAGFTGEAGDCFARAVAIATGVPYETVYDLVNTVAKETTFKQRGKLKRSNAREGVYKETSKAVMAHLGWRWVPTMAVGRGCTVHLDENELPKGRLVCRVSKHFVAVIDGVIHDTHDCTRGGTRCVYGYFIKKD